MTHIKTYLWKEWAQSRCMAGGTLSVVLIISWVSWLVGAGDAGEGMMILGNDKLHILKLPEK